MKKIAIAAVLAIAVLGGAFSANAETKIARAEWEYPLELNNTIDGFRLYDQDHTMVAEIPNPGARTGDFEVDFTPGECRSYYLVAYQGEEDSQASNIYPFCMARKPLQGVGTFTIEFE